MRTGNTHTKTHKTYSHKHTHKNSLNILTQTHTQNTHTNTHTHKAHIHIHKHKHPHPPTSSSASMNLLQDKGLSQSSPLISISCQSISSYSSKRSWARYHVCSSMLMKCWLHLKYYIHMRLKTLQILLVIEKQRSHYPLNPKHQSYSTDIEPRWKGYWRKLIHLKRSGRTVPNAPYLHQQ